MKTPKARLLLRWIRAFTPLLAHAVGRRRAQLLADRMELVFLYITERRKGASR